MVRTARPRDINIMYRERAQRYNEEQKKRKKSKIGGMFLTLADFYDRKSRCSGIVKAAERASANGKDRTCRFCGGGTNVMRWTAVVRPPPSLSPRVFIVDRRKRHRQPFFYSVSTYFGFSLSFFFPDNWPPCLSATGQIRKLFGIMEFTWTQRQSSLSVLRGDVWLSRNTND